MMNSEPKRKSVALPPWDSFGAVEKEVISKFLDAVMSGDERRRDELIHKYPQLQIEFEGMVRVYSERKEALRTDPNQLQADLNAVDQELTEVPLRRENEELTAEHDGQPIPSFAIKTSTAPKSLSSVAPKELIVGKLTDTVSDLEEAVKFFQAFAYSIVRSIAKDFNPRREEAQLREDARLLCSHETVLRFHEAGVSGKSARELLIDILAEQWKDGKLSKTLTPTRLEKMLEENGLFSDHLKIWETFVQRAAA